MPMLLFRRYGMLDRRDYGIRAAFFVQIVEVRRVLAADGAEVWYGEPSADSACGFSRVRDTGIALGAMVVVGTNDDAHVWILPAQRFRDGLQVAGVECDGDSMSR